MENANERRARPMTALASGVSSSLLSPEGNWDEVIKVSLNEGTEWMMVVDAETAGKRIDAQLARTFPTFSRSRIKDLILDGAVTVDGETICDPSYRVKPGSEVVLVAPEPVDAEPEPENIPLDVLFEDDALIVINKPVGMVVHPAPGSPDGTLVNALLFHCGDSLAGIGGVRRPGIVHRLDKDTSGVMVAAKTERALNALAAQFADHGRTGPLTRAYTAFVWGTVPTPRGTIDAPLGRDARNRLKQAVRKDGREAITHYSVERRFGQERWAITRVDCRLETGRTHQIRVHMAHIGHPLVADPLYATGFATKANSLPEVLKKQVQGLGRQALHAAKLGFEHPQTHENLEFSAPLPPDLESFEKALDPYDLSGALSASS
jgi:23S rRNA pseudouridine1911/1915/1917 synthase